jgi:TRAP transporter TAXI family solute receptor
MASRVLRIRLRLWVCFALIGLVATANATMGSAKDRGVNPNADWLGVIAGGEAGSETALATEMADLFPADGTIRVVPMLGDGGLGNIKALLSEPHIDAAFVSTDALATAQNQDPTARLTERLEVVARFCPQEVHVVARADIASLADLAGKKVNFGPTGGSSTITAALLFRALGIEVDPVALDGRTAVEQLAQGAIAASVIVGAKPTPLIGEIPAGLGIHLLSIEFGRGLEETYLPARLEHDDYPNLIAAREWVPSVATGMVLLAAKTKDDPGHADRVAVLVDTLFSRFGELQTQDRHPKWREINLAAGLPGWSRATAAEAWLAQHPDKTAAPATAKTKIEAGAAVPVSQDQREALFRQFIEWQRTKGH